ncbi:LOW QUALITY PROTEIN: hypothetical protein SETIT_6G147300v2 [Setaria italica]|uniref:Uncharacterized protein n=2 Tax=Setaria italica TaxID=4555 RepID=A0A368RLN4_SETIT|nr:LOW QUALITY PROTEIN: hypothetical protein SETIT_6G147300v2 [Setaria italica]
MAMAVGQQQQCAPSTFTSSPPPRLRAIDTTLVPPSPTGSVLPESSLPLTFFDTLWLPFPPVERLFLYRLAPGADVPAILSNLKDALSRALSAFYPLAGRLVLTPSTSNRYELHYRPGDGVAFTVAEYDVGGGMGVDGIDGLGTDEPREVARIAPLVPALPAALGRRRARRATLLLPARRGLAIGVAVHHAAVDGSSSTHFLHTWAASSCTPPPPPPPVIDRSLLPDAFFQVMSTTGTIEVGQMPADQLLATFTLSKDDLQRVKDAVAAEAARCGVAPPRCTSLVAALGFVWSCYHRAKEATSSSSTPMASAGVDGCTCCLIFPVDHRSRMSPPLPDKYLGNCVGPAFAVAPKDALAGGGHRRSGARRRQDGQHGRVDGPRQGGCRLDGHAVRGLAEVSRLRAGPGVRLAGEGGHRRAGGMEVGVPLPPDVMDRFRMCFADAIAGLYAQS